MKNIFVCVILVASQCVIAQPNRRAEAVAVVPSAERAEDASARTSGNGVCERSASAAPDIVKVKGVGMGETEETALKDAYRDAVESAVGMYVDAEQAAKNDVVIKDEILTHSNAYIEDYDEIEKKTVNGLVKIKILARVKRQEITKRISGTMKAKTYKVGGGLKNLHAQMTTAEKKSSDGAALLAKALEGVDPLRQLMEVSLATGEAVQIQERTNVAHGHRGAESDDNMVTLAYLFKFEINRERYFNEFLPNLERVLTQVSEVEPKEIVINAKDSLKRQRFNNVKEDYLASNRGNYINKLNQGMIFGEKQFSSTVFGEVSGKGCRTAGDTGSLDVVVVTEANESMTAVRGKTFSLDAGSAAVIDDFRDGKLSTVGDAARNAKSRKGGWRVDSSLPTYDVLFLDGQGKTIAAHQIGIQYHGCNVKELVACENIVSVRPSLFGETGMRNNRFWFVTPFIGCEASAYYQWCSFKIAKDDLPKIDSIKIELAK